MDKRQMKLRVNTSEALNTFDCGNSLVMNIFLWFRFMSVVEMSGVIFSLESVKVPLIIRCVLFIAIVFS
jgi:hypothetical protein